MIGNDIIKDLNMDFVKMKSPSIGYVGYNLDFHILGIIYENGYNEIHLYENVEENIFNDILKEQSKCGVYIALNIKNMYELTIIPRRQICRTLFV